MKNKLFLQDVKFIKTTAYEKTRSRLDCFYLGFRSEIFCINSNVSSSFLNRYYKNVLPQIVDCLDDSVSKKLKRKSGVLK